MFLLGRNRLTTALLACIQILGIAIFCKGFFPYKVYLPGYAIKEDLPSYIREYDEPHFDRLVFIVIDALRNDFVLGKNNGFDFIQHQIEKKAAYPFTARATAPTVTMPRIKALTTGTIPSFLDAILNIADSDTSSSLHYYDNWLYQFKNNGNKTMHFFGDDTWIRLFPDMFDKFDGTTSFYVSDTVEVDVNVTRHIQPDLTQSDWDAVILHYLGLDHIGHLGGPNSPLMLPKQKEMDRAIGSIYDIISAQDAVRMVEEPNAKGTLMIVCGDHGMNEIGNHGGSSTEETSAAMVFLSPQFESRPSLHKKASIIEKRPMVMGFPVIDQIDIVPTLASLFSFPIPKNNLGKLIPDIYHDDKLYLHHLQLNAFQLGQLLCRMTPDMDVYIRDPLNAVDNQLNEAGQLYAKAVHIHQQYGAESAMLLQIISYYEQFITLAQSHLVDIATDYSLPHMVTGIVLILMSAFGFVAIQYELGFFMEKSIWGAQLYFSVIFLVMTSISMFASSFIEEEQSTWYYMTQTFFLLMVVQCGYIPNVTLSTRLYCIGIFVAEMILLRLTLAWNMISKITQVQGLQWPILAGVLLASVCMGTYHLFKQTKRPTIDVHQTATIIQNIIKSILVIINVLTAVLVFVYKTKADSSADVPMIYINLHSWELIDKLSLIELGQLIYNYSGAGLFVLIGLCYVLKRTEQMNLDQPSGSYTDNLVEILVYMVVPLFLLLSSPKDAIFYLLFMVQFQLLLTWQRRLSEVHPPVWVTGLLVTCLSHTSFFLMGHTNSIASIDLSNAYIGVNGYNTILIGFLTFVSNWSGSLFWVVAGWALCFDKEPTSGKHHFREYINLQSTVLSMILSSLSIAVTLLREHLFIWTVFSPKYLYQVAWTCLFHWVFHVFLGIISKSLLS
ncbi:alkaline-phosphatase-like protein, partial [Pilobolus umbonatus]